MSIEGYINILISVARPMQNSRSERTEYNASELARQQAAR